MPVTEHTAESFTSPARSEPSISPSHDFTDVIVVTGISKFEGALDELFSSFLNGCGMVSLHSVTLKVITSAAGQKVQAGFSSATSNTTIDVVSGKLNGFFHRSNNMNVGNQIVAELIPEDTLSRQIRPCSSLLPMLRFHIAVTDGADVFVHFKVKVHGIRYHQHSLN